MPSPIAAAIGADHQHGLPNEGKLRMVLERRGPHVQIGYRINDSPTTILREVRGFAAFSPEGSWHVGVMINQPGRENKEGLEVEFENFELEYF
jgi:regulation of enolase protein 1 (concanavalin A-like superfamily)